MKIWPAIEAAAITGGAILGFFIGPINGLFLGLLALMLLDMISGITKGIEQKDLSSAKIFLGIIKKIAMVVVVASSNVLDTVLMPDKPILRTAAISFYILNEGVSILENLSLIGVPIPAKIKNVLSVLRKKEAEENDNDGNGDGTE